MRITALENVANEHERQIAECYRRQEMNDSRFELLERRVERHDGRFDELEARADGWDDSFHAFKKREEGHVEEIKSLRKDVDKMQEVLPSMQEAQTKHKKQIIELEQLAKRQQTVINKLLEQLTGVEGNQEELLAACEKHARLLKEAAEDITKSTKGLSRTKEAVNEHEKRIDKIEKEIHAEGGGKKEKSKKSGGLF